MPEASRPCQQIDQRIKEAAARFAKVDNSILLSAGIFFSPSKAEIGIMGESRTAVHTNAVPLCSGTEAEDLTSNRNWKVLRVRYQRSNLVYLINFKILPRHRTSDLPQDSFLRCKGRRSAAKVLRGLSLMRTVFQDHTFLLVFMGGCPRLCALHQGPNCIQALKLTKLKVVL
ncbi:hypothetical protein SISNIDRAFT_470934 [Sistotremastrum niveocremeum HHB9708]|uniref:Uncharacterized protein n=1 Tax=Sistotremastrum niveocremeum HHB9708 TaxID=1314777 RepID=A0A164N8T2_9AGAM|nr:hypothetical protein SISNIDRAFT_470934 [Sistotremastrum niveocremeum HHB9708]